MRVSVLLFAAACADPEPPPDGPEVTSKVVTFDVPFAGRSRVDVLFVIDSSTAMVPYRDHLVAQLPRFAEVLADAPVGMADMNIAVTSADFAGAGALRSSPLVDGAYLIDGMRDGIRVRNYTGELGNVLANLADIGATEDSPPRPLDVLPLALAAPGFVRDGAYLAIVTISGADDASSVAVQDIAAAVKGTKSDPANVMALGIYARPAVRLDAFHAQFPYRAQFTPIDAVDPIEGLASIANLYRSYGLSVCVGEPTLVDVDPNAPGEQYDCVIDVLDVATSTSALWPRCGGGVTPCWNLQPNPNDCGDRLGLSITLGVEGLPYDGGIIRGQCLSE